MEMPKILVIDDNTAIHEDFRKILGIETHSDTHYEAVKKALFAKPAVETIKRFRMDFAYQGKDGLKLVETAIANKDPYAMAFVDVLMPPGWDGVETVQHIWEVDPNIQIVLCTASSGYSWEDIMKALGQLDKILFLRKPFDSMEACQLAYYLTEKWRSSTIINAEIEELKKLLMITFGFINDAILLLDEKFNIVLCNPIVSESYGYTNDELNKMNISDLHLDEDKESTISRMDKIIESGEETWLATHVRKNGSKFMVDINTKAVTVNNVTKFIVIVKEASQHS